jgi:anti-sigma factor RsiW
MSCTATQELLSAYVDGELPFDQATDVAEHLTECAGCAQEYEMVLKTVQVLRAGLAPARAPDVLRARIRSALREKQPSPATAVRNKATMPWRAIAAAFVIAFTASALTLVATRLRSEQPALAEEILTSHIRSLMPDHLTDVRSNDQHNVKPWFNGRLDYSPTVPRLDDAGFTLLGGRLDYVHKRPVAVVVYSRRQHLINWYSWPADVTGDLAATAEARQGYNLIHWRHAGIDSWAVSDLNASELRQFVTLLSR